VARLIESMLGTCGSKCPSAGYIPIYLILWEREGMHHAPLIAPGRRCGGLHQGSPSRPKAFGQECPVSSPLNTPFAGVPAASLYVRLICAWTRQRVKLGQIFLRPELSGFLLLP